jgi:hypothetical protein
MEKEFLEIKNLIISKFDRVILKSLYNAPYIKDNIRQQFVISNNLSELMKNVKNNLQSLALHDLWVKDIIENHKEVFQLHEIFLNEPDKDKCNYGHHIITDYNYVELTGTATGYSYNNSIVELRGRARLFAHNTSIVRAYDNTKMFAYDNTVVIAFNKSVVILYDESIVDAFDSTYIVPSHFSTVILHNNANVDENTNTTNVLIRRVD